MRPLIASCVLALTGTVVFGTGDDGLKKTLSNIAKDAAVKELKGKKFDINEGEFSGTFEAIDPEKNVTVEVKDFSLDNDMIKTQGVWSL